MASLCAVGVHRSALAQKREGGVPPAVAPEKPIVTQPSEQLRRAANAFEHGDYSDALKILDAVLYPLRLSDPEEIKQARVYRATCLHLQGDLPGSESEFFQLLLADPSHQLDALFTPPRIVEFFEDLKTRRGKELRPALPSAIGDAAPARATHSNSQPGLLAIAPLGISQMRNGETRKAYALLGVQTALLATNIATYVTLQRMEGDDGLFSTGRVAEAQRLQTVNLTALGLLLGTAIYGGVDGYRHRVRSQRVRLDVRGAAGVTFSLTASF